jgi:hypothetical protein
MLASMLRDERLDPNIQANGLTALSCHRSIGQFIETATQTNPRLS